MEPKFTDKLGCIVKIDQSWYEDIRQRKIEFLVGAYEKGDKEHSGRWADKKLDVPWLLNGHFFQVTKSANRSFVFENKFFCLKIYLQNLYKTYKLYSIN